MPRSAKERKLHPEIDLDAAPCLDVGHHWRIVEWGRYSRTGALRGLVARISICEGCASGRVDVLGWDGRVLSRYYNHDQAYIENSRALGDQHERRRNYRSEAVRQHREAPWLDL